MELALQQEKAKHLRADILKMLCCAKSGHPGGSLSCVEILMALYYNVMKVDPSNPHWEQRDRFVLSKGHACPALYAVLADKGFFPREELWTLRKTASHLQGHPDMRKTAGVDVNTGSLGQGVSIAGGLAMEEELAKTEGGLAAEYAAVRYALYRRGFQVEMLTAFEPRLYWAEQWWKQLFGESEGKEKKGMLPASMINSEDLHSMGQYMQDGLRFMTETFLAVDDPGASVVIEPDPDFGDGFDYLDGMDFANINRAAEKATIQAHAAGGVPCTVLRLPRIDEHTFGLLYYFFMASCALSGRLLGVDPFDQEGVEEYKRSMFAALGKPGVKGR